MGKHYLSLCYLAQTRCINPEISSTFLRKMHAYLGSEVGQRITYKHNSKTVPIALPSATLPSYHAWEV